MNDDFKITLYAARINAGLSRNEVCEAIPGLSLEMLGKIESGAIEPKVTLALKLCELYGISIDRLRFDDVKPIKRAARRTHKEAKDNEGKADGDGK